MDQRIDLFDNIKSVKQGSDDWFWLRQYAQGNLYTFEGKVLGFERDRLGRDGFYAPIHAPMARFMQTDDPYKMVLVFRGAGKTTVCTTGYLIWRIVCHLDPFQVVSPPHIDYSALVLSWNQKQADKILDGIKRHFLKTGNLHHLFPELKAGDKFTPPFLDFQRQHRAAGKEYVLEALGLTCSPEGSHYDEVIADDCVVRENSQSSAMLEDTRMRMAEYLALFNPISRRWVIVGVPQCVGDAYDFILQNEGIGEFPTYEKFHLGCFGRAGQMEGMSVYPTRFTNQYLAHVRAFNPAYFASNFTCDPKAAMDGNCDERWLKWYASNEVFHKDVLSKAKQIFVVDPAATEHSGSDSTGIVGVAALNDGSVYVIEGTKGIVSITTVADQLAVYIGRYPHARYLVESIHFQDFYRQALEAELRKRGINTYLEPTGSFTQVNAKDMRARSVIARAQRGLLYLPYGETVVRNQLLRWHPGRRHDVDALDALGHCIRYCPEPTFVVVVDRAMQEAAVSSGDGGITVNSDLLLKGSGRMATDVFGYPRMVV